MAFNLIDMVRDRFSGNVVQQMGSSLGEDPGTLGRALPGAIAAVGGSVVERGSTEAGASRLMSQLNEGGFTGPNAGNEDVMSPDMAERGHGMLGGLFGDKLSTITSTLTRTGGLSNSGSASKLLAMVAPIMMGVIGKQVRDNRMSAGGLSQLLGSQRSSIASMLPAGLGNLLGAKPTRAVEEVVTETRTTPSVETVRRAPVEHVAQQQHTPPKRNLSWVIPVALLALLAGWFLTRSRRDHTRQQQASVTQPAPQQRPTDQATGGAGTAGTGRVPPVANDAQSMRQAFDSGAASFILAGVGFQQGSAQMTPQSDASVGQLASVMRDKPDSRIRIAGHTDGTGDAAANQQLARQRAESVRSALISDGVDANRVEVASAGASAPVASDNTAQGRDQNRRIEVQVLSR
ncbi:OmpA family protein [Myxococcus sp. K15C18031901]|uniref:OmpA family protein n=1 Tax=Myxococcus dinghuensis TaxID=2906761 RepID=UPI0020A7DD1B|nr:OmpA family protein [Myxococcus dinghuensis]MCP3101251.1 OmpA family protein [Myxococcus dinghuensis]